MTELRIAVIGCGDRAVGVISNFLKAVGARTAIGLSLPEFDPNKFCKRKNPDGTIFS